MFYRMFNRIALSNVLSNTLSTVPYQRPIRNLQVGVHPSTVLDGVAALDGGRGTLRRHDADTRSADVPSSDVWCDSEGEAAYRTAILVTAP